MMSGLERVIDNIEWLIKFWEEIPEPTFEDRLRALSLLYAELDSSESK